jgi:hypothetical protein
MFQCVHARDAMHTNIPLSTEPYLPWQNNGESTVRETCCKQPEGNDCATVPVQGTKSRPLSRFEWVIWCDRGAEYPEAMETLGCWLEAQQQLQ